jgi:hypothetical protein
VACFITFVFFLIFGINLKKAAERSLEDMYRSKKLRPNIIIPINIALIKVKKKKKKNNNFYFKPILYFFFYFQLYKDEMD